MANDFTKEERVLFEDMQEEFEDALVLSKNVSVFRNDSTTMERANNTIWRPMPYVSESYDGTDASANFRDSTQLSVPATLGYQKHATAILTAEELRDATQEGSLGRAKVQKLASDINVAVMNVAASQGTIVSKVTTAATGFVDVAAIEALFNEQGIQHGDRYAAYSTRDYNGMAANLAARGTMNQKPTTAYEEAYVGTVASFKTYKFDYANRLAAAAGGGALTIDTQATASNYYTPVATSTAATGEVSNVDNRYQTITISATTNVAAGDCFTIAGVYAVHHITKGSTGQLKTFRVISVDSGTTMTISPPIISNQGSTAAEAAYQNCDVTPAAAAAIVFLNTVAAAVNPFWHKDAIELLPGRYVVPANAGVAVARSSTANGIEICMTKWFDGNVYKTKFRWDIFFGVCLKQPEMAGIQLFSQT